MAEILAIDIVGADYHGNVEKNIIYRLNRKPSIITDYPYLVVCEKIDQMLSLSPSIADIFVVKDIKKINANLKKNKVKKGIGLEVTIADLRKADGLQVGKWFNQIRGLYKFCKSSNCQLILSSGANSALEMVSGRSFDSILKICDINPESYWRELELWIESKRRIRCL